MKVKVIDKTGKKVEEISLSDKVFKFNPNAEVLKQYIRVYRSNQRQGNASTKTRSEVRGGGRKPWKQKGTGRARHGSRRSPIWVHGGVAHGPKPKSWELKLPKKMKAIAFKSALSLAFSDNKAVVMDKIEFKDPKTKEMNKILEKNKILGKTLIVWSGKDNNLVKSSRNIPFLNITNADTLSAYDLIESNNVLFLKEAVMELEKKYENR